MTYLPFPIQSKNYALRILSLRQLRIFAGAVLALCLSPVSLAQNRPVSRIGNTVTISPATISGPLTNTGVIIENGRVVARTTQDIIAGTRSVPVVIKGQIPMAAVGGALANFVRKGIPLLNTVSALYQLGRELDLIISNRGNKTVIEQEVHVPCPDCFFWSYGSEGPWYGTPGAAGQAYLAAFSNNANSPYVISLVGCSDTGCEIKATNNSVNPPQDKFSTFPLYKKTGGQGDEIKLVEITPDKFASLIETMNPAPTTKLAQALGDALDSGVSLLIPAPTSLSGPSSILETPITTTNSDGSTSKVQTQRKLTYSPPNIEIGESTVTTNTSKDGDVTTTTTDKPSNDSLSDCDKYPNSNGCRSDEYDVPDATIPKITKEVTFSAMDLGFPSGSCPANVTVSAFGQNIKAWDWSAGCDLITKYLKPLLLLMASFTAMVILFAEK